MRANCEKRKIGETDRADVAAFCVGIRDQEAYGARSRYGWSSVWHEARRVPCHCCFNVCTFTPSLPSPVVYWSRVSEPCTRAIPSMQLPKHHLANPTSKFQPDLSHSLPLYSHTFENKSSLPPPNPPAGLLALADAFVVVVVVVVGAALLHPPKSSSPPHPGLLAGT